MKKIIIQLVLVFLAFVSFAQQKQDEIISIINESTAEITSLKCNFTQKGHLKMLNDVVTSNGIMCFSGGNKLRWEYTSPYTYTFILNDSQVFLKKNGQQDVIDVNQNKMFKEIARIMMNSVLGKSLSDTKSFEVHISDKNDFYEAEMIPVKKDMQQIFPSLNLCFDKKQKFITKVVLNQKNGDYTEIFLTDIQKNTKISDDVFKVE